MKDKYVYKEYKTMPIIIIIIRPAFIHLAKCLYYLYFIYNII